LQKIIVVHSGFQPAPDAEQSTVCPSTQRGRIRRPRSVFALRAGLLEGLPCGNSFTSLLSAKHAEVSGRRQPVWQDCKRRAARRADTAPHPDTLVQLIVGLTKSSAMADDCVAEAQRAAPRQEMEWDHPASSLSFVAGNAIKRITAGVKARR